MGQKYCIILKKEGIENNKNNSDNTDETNNNNENGDDIYAGESNNSDNNESTNTISGVDDDDELRNDETNTNNNSTDTSRPYEINIAEGESMNMAEEYNNIVNCIAGLGKYYDSLRREILFEKTSRSNRFFCIGRTMRFF